MSDQEIIEEGLLAIGTSNISLLDGLTLATHDVWYNIYVNNGTVVIDKID